MANRTQRNQSTPQQIQQKQEEKADLTPKGFFDLNAPIRISNEFDDKTYVEYMMDSHTRTGKLAVINDARSKRFDPNNLVSQRNFADLGSNYSSNPDLIAKISNEKVKVELAKEYFQNPKVYTLEVVNAIIKNLENEYSFTEDELSALTDMAGDKDRLAMIASAQQKLNNGDRALIDGVRSINYLMDNYQKVEKFQQGTLSTKVSKGIKDYFRDTCFSDEFNWKETDSRQKDAITYHILEGNREQTIEMLKEFGYSNDTELIGQKATDMLKHAKIAKEAHSEINKNIKTASTINSDIKIKEQFIMLDDFVKKANTAISSGKSSDVLAFKKAVRERAGSGESGSFTGILKEIDETNETDLVKQINSKKGLNVEAYKSDVIKGIDKYVFENIRGKLKDLEVEDKAIEAVIGNYKKLVKDIRGGEKQAEKGLSFNTSERDEIHKDFEKNNIIALLGGGSNELAKKLINENSFSDISIDLERDMVDNSVEIMNSYNMMCNKSVDVQPDEVDKTTNQCMNNSALKSSTQRVVKSDVNLQERNKEGFEKRVSDIAGAKNYLRLNEISKELDTSINRFLIPRETLSRFKSCLTNAITAKTTMDTLSSTSAQCADKLMSDLQGDINRIGGQVMQAGQGLASVLPIALLLSIQEESLKHIERQFIDEQNKVGEDMAKIIQDLNSASTEIDKEARLELIANETQGGVSISAIHQSEAYSYRNALNKERVAERLEKNSFKDKHRSIDEILNDESYGFKAVERELPAKKTEEPEQAISDKDTKDILDLNTENLNDKLQENDSEAPQESQDDSVEIVTDLDNKDGNTTPASDDVEEKQNKEAKKSTVVLKDIIADEENSKGEVKANRPTLEKALRDMFEKEEALALKFLQEKDKEAKRDEYKANIDSIERDKHVIQEELILVSLIEMERNSHLDNKYQPSQKIRDAVMKYKHAIRKPNEDIYDIDFDNELGAVKGEKIDPIDLSSTDKKTIISDAMAMIEKNNPSMNDTFLTIRGTNATATVEKKGMNGISTVQTAVNDKAFILKVFQDNEHFLHDKTNEHSDEKELAYNAMREVTKGTSLEQEVNTYDDYVNMFEEVAQGSQDLRQADGKIKEMQKNEYISHHLNEIRG
jgi:hypothetical protein